MNKPSNSEVSLAWLSMIADLLFVDWAHICERPQHLPNNWARWGKPQKKESQSFTRYFFIIVIWVSKALIILISKFINCQLL